MAEDLNFLVIVPKGDGECREFELSAAPRDTGEKLKKRIEKLCSIPTDDQELFVKGSLTDKPKWLFEDATLEEQDVVDNSIITVAVHGRLAPEEKPPSDLPDEQRIASGGPPQKISARPVSSTSHDESEEVVRPEARILNYSWGDEKEFVKIYISKDSEPEVIGAAGDGQSGQVRVDWQSRALKLVVHTPRKDFVLNLERIYYEIVPEDCKWKVSTNKRITLSLKKKVESTWLKLLKPE